MAPNLVTTIGLSLTTAAYLLMYITAPKLLSLDTPAWVFPTAALGLFVYQTLDNMDGKQVRVDNLSQFTALAHACFTAKDGIVHASVLYFEGKRNRGAEAEGSMLSLTGVL